MNEIVNMFSLAREKFMSEMHLRQPGFTYSACGSFTKNKERMQKFKETRDSRYIYQDELDMDRIQHDMAYEYFKDLPRRTASDKVLHDKEFNIAKNPKYDEYQRGLASMIYNFFDKKSTLLTKKSASGSAAKSEISANQRPLDLAEEIHKPIIRNFKKSKVYSSFKDNIWCAGLPDIQLISKFNKGLLIFIVNTNAIIFMIF